MGRKQKSLPWFIAYRFFSGGQVGPDTATRQQGRGFSKISLFSRPNCPRVKTRLKRPEASPTQNSRGLRFRTEWEREKLWAMNQNDIGSRHSRTYNFTRVPWRLLSLAFVLCEQQKKRPEFLAASSFSFFSCGRVFLPPGFPSKILPTFLSYNTRWDFLGMQSQKWNSLGKKGELCFHGLLYFAKRPPCRMA